MKTALFPTIALLLTFDASANASLISFDGQPVDQNGTGHGNVLNVLTVQNSPSEFGSVLLNSAGNDVTADDAKNQSQTQTVADLTAAGITADNFAVVFNINQSGQDKTLGLGSFTLRFYTDPADLTQYFDAVFTPGGSNASTASLAPIDPNGTGNAGWLFNVTFSPAEAAAFFGNGNNRVGAFVPSGDPIAGSDSGPDNFYVTNANNLVAAPEPATAMLLAVAAPGLALGGLRRYRRARRPRCES